jgi:hypothetical protein
MLPPAIARQFHEPGRSAFGAHRGDRLIADIVARTAQPGADLLIASRAAMRPASKRSATASMSSSPKVWRSTRRCANISSIGDFDARRVEGERASSQARNCGEAPCSVRVDLEQQVLTFCAVMANPHVSSAQTKRAANAAHRSSCHARESGHPVTTAARERSPLGLLDCPVKPGNDNHVVGGAN